jgi:hypothetical protein
MSIRKAIALNAHQLVLNVRLQICAHLAIHPFIYKMADARSHVNLVFLQMTPRELVKRVILLAELANFPQPTVQHAMQTPFCNLTSAAKTLARWVISKIL